MKITKFEQSGLIIETTSGFRLAIDIADMTPIEKLQGIQVDAVVVSHIHPDHFSIDHIKALNPKTVYLNAECIETLGEEQFPFVIQMIVTNETVSVGEVSMAIFGVDHGPNVSAPLKENFGFLLEVENQKMYFAGDMFYGSGIDAAILEVDYAFLPVGTFYTFGPEEAFAFAKTFKSIKNLVPIHDRNKHELTHQFVALAQKDFHVMVM